MDVRLANAVSTRQCASSVHPAGYVVKPYSPDKLLEAVSAENKAARARSWTEGFVPDDHPALGLPHLREHPHSAPAQAMAVEVAAHQL